MTMNKLKEFLAGERRSWKAFLTITLPFVLLVTIFSKVFKERMLEFTVSTLDVPGVIMHWVLIMMMLVICAGYLVVGLVQFKSKADLWVGRFLSKFVAVILIITALAGIIPTVEMSLMLLSS